MKDKTDAQEALDTLNRFANIDERNPALKQAREKVQKALRLLDHVEQNRGKIGWQPIETAPKSKRIIGAWLDGKWQVAELWYDDTVDEWTHTSGDYYCKPTSWMLSPDTTENRKLLKILEE